MGKRKQLSAEALKEVRKTQYFAKLNNVPSSPHPEVFDESRFGRRRETVAFCNC